jgi:hypothetical protein
LSAAFKNLDRDAQLDFTKAEFGVGNDGGTKAAAPPSPAQFFASSGESVGDLVVLA